MYSSTRLQAIVLSVNVGAKLSCSVVLTDWELQDLLIN